MSPAAKLAWNVVGIAAAVPLTVGAVVVLLKYLFSEAPTWVGSGIVILTLYVLLWLVAYWIVKEYP